jgi:hypothetical protein
MKRFIILIFITLSLVHLTAIEGKANYTNEQFEKSLYDIGYKEVHSALDEAQTHFHQKIPLPVQIPPITFTHSFGRFNDLQGEMNDEFEIEYFNKDAAKNHYMVWIKPAKHKLKIEPRLIDKTIHLKDGSEAIVSNKKLGKRFYVLLFEDKGWQYILSIDSANSENVSPDMLVDIANSLK